MPLVPARDDEDRQGGELRRHRKEHERQVRSFVRQAGGQGW